jgi:hypothetical protein
MKTRDRRFHSEDPLHAQAAELLRKKAEMASCEFGTIGDSARHHQRNREKYPDAYGNRPGAFLERFCTPEQRELLKNLRSDPDENMPTWLRWILPPGHPDNKIGGVLEWSPPTIWSFT